jgi:uncharacterized membrane protein YccC
MACVAGGLICFFVAFLTIPLLALKPRKFAVAFTYVLLPLLVLSSLLSRWDADDSVVLMVCRLGSLLFMMG